MLIAPRFSLVAAVLGTLTLGLAALQPPSAIAAEPGARRKDAAAATSAVDEPATKAAGPGVGTAAAGPAAAPRRAAIEKLTGVWVEGPGYDITYGGTYEVCAERCAAGQKCVMIEYYRPEKKCNLYSSMRPRKTGGSSFVGIKG